MCPALVLAAALGADAVADCTPGESWAPVKVDAPPGFENPQWATAPARRLVTSLQQQAVAESDADAADPPSTTGWVRLLADADALYLRADLADTDLYNAANDQDAHVFTRGDTLEWFIGKPPPVDWSVAGTGPGWYYELHVTPEGQRRAYLIREPGSFEPLAIAPFEAEIWRWTPRSRPDLFPADQSGGGWSVVMTLPWTALARVDPGWRWGDGLSTLVGRYDRTRDPRQPEAKASRRLTMWPAQPRTAFHLRRHHAPIVFPPREHAEP